MAEAQIFLNGDLVYHAFLDPADLCSCAADLAPADQIQLLMDHLEEYTRLEGFNSMGRCLVRVRHDEDRTPIPLDLSAFQELVVRL